ncbi:LacI family DNA-binding transcriptional regulator [Amycolatopsis sp. NPDC059021]|uniref:LacI family DNA-binding transcriptional regulator n=1 Tax=Amycolatopsis sp. NPDC059021 TaxID=3346704 RepID=UPI00366D2D06
MVLPSRPATIRDVANMVGVSHQTVSRVINDSPNVDPETRRRVLDAANVLKYRPSRHARALAKPDVKTIGLLVPDLTNPFFPEVIEGVLDAAGERGWQVTIRTTGRSDEREVLRATIRSADAVVGYFTSAGVPSSGREWDVPVVALDNELDGPQACGVQIDVEDAVRQGIGHLLERGHTEIGMLDCSTTCDRHRRREAFVRVLTEHGIPPAEGRIRMTDQSFDGAAAATHVLVDGDPELTAIFAFNDVVAIGALRALRARGLRVPGDCAVLGFDGLAIGGLVTPTLTSLHIDTRRLGALAVEQVEAMIANPPEETATSQVLLQPRLVVGGST